MIGLVKDGESHEVNQGDELRSFSTSPQYAEAGQMADRTPGNGGDGAQRRRRSTKKLWVHKATVQNGGLDLGSTVTAEVDGAWRHGARLHRDSPHPRGAAPGARSGGFVG